MSEYVHFEEAEIISGQQVGSEVGLGDLALLVVGWWWGGGGGGGLMPTISAKTSAFPRSADIFLEPDYFLGAGLFSWSRNQFDKSDSDLLIKKESHNRTNCLLLKCFKFFVVVIVQKGFLSYEIKIQKFCGSGSVFDAGQESKSYPR